MGRLLTEKQWEVSRLVSLGMNNREIGTCIGTTKHVVKNYVSNIFDATGMNSRLELTLWYLAHYGDKAEKLKS